MFDAGIAVDDVTASQPATTDASWPMLTRTPSALILSTTSES